MTSENCRNIFSASENEMDLFLEALSLDASEFLTEDGRWKRSLECHLVNNYCPASYGWKLCMICLNSTMHFSACMVCLFYAYYICDASIGISV